MDKYVLLFVLNIPFVIFGVLKAVMAYRTKTIDSLTFVLRLVFWGLILTVLIFAQSIYEYGFRHGWTDSSPLSLFDVVLATGILLCLSLCVGLYAKVDALEKRLSDLHERVSIILSTKDKDKDPAD